MQYWGITLHSLQSRVSHVRAFIREFEKFCMVDRFNLCVNFKMAWDVEIYAVDVFWLLEFFGAS